MLFYVFTGVMVLIAGCATKDRYINTFTPVGVGAIKIYGTVTEVQVRDSGVGVKAGMTCVPVSDSADVKNAHIAIDIRVVNAASELVIAARRIAGSALSGEAAASTRLGGGKTKMPISLGAYKNTSMELTIRDCIYRSVIYSCKFVPQNYLKH